MAKVIKVPGRNRAETVKTFNNAFDIYVRLKEYYDKGVEKFTYSITVDYDYRFYPAVVEWVSQRIFTRTFGTAIFDKELKFFPSNKTKAHFHIGPHKYSFVAAKPSKGRGDALHADDDYDTKNAVPSLHFTCHSKVAFEILKEELSKVYVANKDKIVPHMYVVGGYSGWSATLKEFPRSIDSVFLAPGLKEAIQTDLETFFASRTKMHRVGLPHHRGYIFYGPPGNGKTSISKALADHYNLNIYTLSLAGVKSDKELIALIQEMKPRSILLIEDIDVFSKVLAREQSDGLTLSGLLNALDGVMTPDGLVTVMTTNAIAEQLDQALMRSGRIDKKYQILAPVHTQIKSMFKSFYEENIGLEPREFERMSDLVGILKEYPDDPEGARLLIKRENGK